MDYNTFPIGPGLAVANSDAAMSRFENMTDDEKKEYVERNRSALSEKEMDKLVSSLAKEDEEPELHLENINQIFKGPGIG